MKSSSALLTMGLAAVGWSVTAAEPDLSKLPPPSGKTDLTYAKDIRPLFEASCFNCHGERRQRQERRGCPTAERYSHARVQENPRRVRRVTQYGIRAVRDDLLVRRRPHIAGERGAEEAPAVSSQKAGVRRSFRRLRRRFLDRFQCVIRRHVLALSIDVMNVQRRI